VNTKIVLSAAILLPLFAFGQSDFVWWNNIHNWDGITPWHRMIQMTPGYMGPNALPVPELRQGVIDSTLSLTLAPETHHSPGDFTLNLFTEINIPVAKNVALQIFWVPVEYFATDTAVRDMRIARTKDATGVVMGDVYIGTNIQLLRNKKNLPDLMLGINIKTASGNGLADARHTDAPGYFFDLSGGKDIALKNNWLLRPHAMAGFYVYHTNREDYFQNDALMFGAGITLKNSQWAFIGQITGWHGYFQDLDSPTIFRLEVRRLFQKSDVFFRFQEGNASYPFTSFRAGIKLNFTHLIAQKT